MELNRYLQNPGIGRSDKLLLILFHEKSAMEVRGIKERGAQHGLQKIKTWNISEILKRSYPQAIKTENGWKITTEGQKRLFDQKLIEKPAVAIQNNTLLSILSSVPDGYIKQYIEETVKAVELGLFRSAIILSWIGCISIMQEYVLQKKLQDFNTELIRRFPKAKKIKKKDDFGYIKEYDFLQICNSISMIGKNVRQELEHRLQLRNSCGHPNSFTVGESTVIFHLEFLINNIYLKF